MSTKVSIGGNRLGSGNKMDLHLRNFERSNHDLGYVWRSTMAPGTLVPYLCEVGLPGDTLDINLDADVKTYPTIGPLFGSFKLQLDVFSCPIRLYQGLLHNNPLGVGMKMHEVLLPQVELITNDLSEADIQGDIDNAQINPSSIMAYLGIRGIGATGELMGEDVEVYKYKNATSWLAYWDIYKNYYANKQEEIGAFISADTPQSKVTYYYRKSHMSIPPETPINFPTLWDNEIYIFGDNIAPERIRVVFRDPDLGTEFERNLTDIATDIEQTGTPSGRSEIFCFAELTVGNGAAQAIRIYDTNEATSAKPQVRTFPLNNLDRMREGILKETGGKPIIIRDDTIAPYGLTIKRDTAGNNLLSQSQQGLALKTYQSDIFNNWVSTEWIDGENGIAEVTAVDVSDGKLKIDALILAKKVHNMLNRVAVSGGSYYDWINAVYTESTNGMNETPTYHGGLSKEIVFEEVVGMAASNADGYNPLGTLAGKGGLTNKHKGGKVYVKVTEPSYIIGIVSITPRVDYSQGNRWDTRLRTMDDFHKPSLDGIGFQDLITDKMAWWDTHGNNNDNEVLNSAGKQPAWLDYMTNYNRTYGHFARKTSEMYMTLNRRYEYNPESRHIADLTTYIDPSKFNYAFAMTDITSQNFWVQIGLDIKARRKISAKQIPNL